MDNLEYEKRRMSILGEFVHAVGNEKISAYYKFLNERISCPESFVVFLGETSSGKTSIVNSLVRKDLLPVSARPTTGTVIEIMDEPDVLNEEYYGVCNDAATVKIDRMDFIKLSSVAKSQYCRLRVLLQEFPEQVTGLRIFDTPGYGSICAEHEEIIKEFIPNSDIIFYIISYRVGFQANDLEFLSYIHELIDDSTEIFLIVNRTHESSETEEKIAQIGEAVEDCLHRRTKVFVVPSSEIREDGTRCAVNVEAVWRQLTITLASEQRQIALKGAFLRYQYDLVLNLKTVIEREIAGEKVTNEQKRQLTMEMDKLARKEKEIICLIRGCFKRLRRQTDKLFNDAIEDAAKEMEEEIFASNKWTRQQEVSGFVQQHFLPIQAKIQSKKISNYFRIELEELNYKVDDLLNGAREEFHTEIAIKIPVFEPLVVSIGQRIVNTIADAGLQRFFVKYGGSGGGGAGVANAAKKGLKAFGDMFGKKFSRETHNAAAGFLKKIGATSTRAVTIAAAVFVEAIIFVWDANTWQDKLRKEIRKALKMWAKESVEQVNNDLKKLGEHNQQQVKEIFASYYDIAVEGQTKEGFSNDLEQMNTILIKLKKVEQEIMTELEAMK